jgi:hypothetical protein
VVKHLTTSLWKNQYIGNIFPVDRQRIKLLYREASLWAENCPNFLAARKKILQGLALNSPKGHVGTKPKNLAQGLKNFTQGIFNLAQRGYKIVPIKILPILAIYCNISRSSPDHLIMNFYGTRPVRSFGM